MSESKESEAPEQTGEASTERRSFIKQVAVILASLGLGGLGGHQATRAADSLPAYNTEKTDLIKPPVVVGQVTFDKVDDKGLRQSRIESDSKPVSGFKVDLVRKGQGDENEIVASAITNEMGVYVIQGVLPGKYSVQVGETTSEVSRGYSTQGNPGVTRGIKLGNYLEVRPQDFLIVGPSFGKYPET